MIKHSEILLGSDPEIFVNDGNGNMLPSFKFLPSKYEPLMTSEKCKFYWDGFQAEFNVIPSSDPLRVLKSLRIGLHAIKHAAQRVDKNATLSVSTVVETPLTMLQKLNQTSPEYVEFGCMPSYNAYNMKGLDLDGVNCPYRFSGGHIHFGISDSEEAMNKSVEIVKNLDSAMGVLFVSLFENFDNPIRRKYYGLAGEYRLPPHGIEYRSLSNAWLINPKLSLMTLKMAQNIVESTVNGTFKWTAAEVTEVINKSHIIQARKILADNFDEIKRLGLTLDPFKPVEQQLPMDDIAKNWML